jgi:hypothetical protein
METIKRKLITGHNCHPIKKGIENAVRDGCIRTSNAH